MKISSALTTIKHLPLGCFHYTLPEKERKAWDHISFHIAECFCCFLGLVPNGTLNTQSSYESALLRCNGTLTVRKTFAAELAPVQARQKCASSAHIDGKGGAHKHPSET